MYDTSSFVFQGRNLIANCHFAVMSVVFRYLMQHLIGMRNVTLNLVSFQETKDLFRISQLLSSEEVPMRILLIDKL